MAKNEIVQPVSFMHTHYDKLTNLEAGKHNDITLTDIKGAVGAISIADGNNTRSTNVACILNDILYPEVQKKFKAEIDTVTAVHSIANIRGS
ncbi:hypothetical protein BJ878DRAFT_232539 [Calycina marina]|uniref:Uncharacterized protein n=1 Tax=Calycina marina TaxID=1763456 RepID=A0A9P7Z8V1_9HELO|nr:hypothetical protein BJ878DRAFT_232539 [Calycina marina]